MSSLLKTRIYEIAKSQGISIRKMERDLGYPEKYIQKIDVHTPSITRVMEMAKYLNVSLDVLTGNELPVFDYADLNDLRFLHDNPEARQLLSKVKNMPKNSIAQLTEIAKVLNENGGL